jgi:CheY-like chemotaxis protein
MRSADQDTQKGPNTLLRKVLVVDDEPDLAEFAAALLGAHGLAAVVAHSGHEAMLRLQEDDEIDAVFSDVMMPGMTGVQLADAVREMYPRVKIVLASGYALPELLAGRARPYLFATKPYRIDTILKLLRS